MQIVVFHRFAYTCCTASFQPFCGMSAIRYKVLNDRTFPQVSYRTLVECEGSGFLGIFVGCGMFLFFEGTALSFRIALLAQECCYFIVNVSLGGEYTFCSHDS